MKTLKVFFSLLICLFLVSCAEYGDTPNLPKDHLSENDLEDSGDDDNTRTNETLSKLPQRNFKSHSLSDIAKWVIKYEARKVGPYCNFFVQRVLHLKGYGQSQWRANEFDYFVSQRFQNFKVATFESQNIEFEREKLRDYIWSHPEKTDFVLQWKRSRGHGHVAILQRIGDKLIIYNASLNDYLAKSKQAKIEVLLGPGRGKKYRLNVYSHFNGVQIR